MFLFRWHKKMNLLLSYLVWHNLTQDNENWAMMCVNRTFSSKEKDTLCGYSVSAMTTALRLSFLTYTWHRYSGKRGNRASLHLSVYKVEGGLERDSLQSTDWSRENCEFGLTRSTRKMLHLLATKLVQKQIDTDLPIQNASCFFLCFFYLVLWQRHGFPVLSAQQSRHWWRSWTLEH